MRIKTISCRKGLSLIEILVSISILSAGAVIVLQALAKVSYSQLVSEQQAKLYLFSLSKMSEMEIASQEGLAPEEKEGSVRLDNQRLDWNVATSLIPDDESLHFTTLSIMLSLGNNSSELVLSTVFRIQEDGK